MSKKPLHYNNNSSIFAAKRSINETEKRLKKALEESEKLNQKYAKQDSESPLLRKHQHSFECKT